MTKSTLANTSSDRPPIPQELLRRPRKVKVKTVSTLIGQWVTRLFVMPHTLVGLAMAGAAIGFPIWIMLGNDHVAQVTAARTYASTDEGHTSQNYEITYRYVLDDHPRERKSRVNEETFKRIGGTLDSLPEAPRYGTVNVREIGWPPLYYEGVVESHRSMWGKWTFIACFALFWNGILLFFWWSSYVMPWRSRRLYRNGQVAFGVITKKYTTKGENPSNMLDYDFTTATGEKGSGKTTVGNSADFNVAAVGEKVIVLHRDGMTKPSELYKYGLYRCVE